jgi:hypothetical protein
LSERNYVIFYNHHSSLSRQILFYKKIAFPLELESDEKNRKYIIFHNKRIKPYIFCMSIHKNDKITKAIGRKYKSEALNNITIN